MTDIFTSMREERDKEIKKLYCKSIKCPYCGSEDIGHYLTSQQSSEEHYQCRKCKHLFQHEDKRG